MPNCEYLFNCLYFNDKLKKMPIASESVKSMYCRWHYDECARYMVASVMGSENVPSDLFPTETDSAVTLLVQFNLARS